MTLRFELAGSLVLAGVLALAFAASLPVLGEDATTTTAAAPAATDADVVAAGKHVWSDAACYNCHGTNGQGGHSTDFPAGPNLRTSGLDPESMLQIIECGIADTRMPAWLKGAYTDVECFGNPLGPVPPGVLVSGAYTEEQLKDLVAYIQVNFMKQPLPAWPAQ